MTSDDLSTHSIRSRLRDAEFFVGYPAQRSIVCCTVVPSRSGALSSRALHARYAVGKRHKLARSHQQWCVGVGGQVFGVREVADPRCLCGSFVLLSADKGSEVVAFDLHVGQFSSENIPHQWSFGDVSATFNDTPLVRARTWQCLSRFAR